MLKLNVHTSIKEIERPKDKFVGFHCIDDYHPINQLYEINRLVDGFEGLEMEWNIWTWSTYIFEYVELLQKMGKIELTIYVDDIESYDYASIYMHLNKPFDHMDDLKIKLFTGEYNEEEINE